MDDPSFSSFEQSDSRSFVQDPLPGVASSNTVVIMSYDFLNRKWECLLILRIQAEPILSI